MQEDKVLFLGEEYSFPVELREYVEFGESFSKVNERLIEELLITIKIPNISDEKFSQVSRIESSLKDEMKNEVKRIISKLGNNDIYDVTESDVLEKNKGYIYYDNVYRDMMSGLAENLKNEKNNYENRLSNAQKIAYSQVTGTGISMFSSSIVAHMVLAAFEASTVKSQCSKADEEYRQLIRELTLKNKSERYQKDVEVMKNTYPEIANALSMFVSELMDYYLEKLQEHSLYNYDRVKKYSISRSNELLNNLGVVSDKKSVLVQAFVSCPYNPDIYKKILEYNLCDIDSFKTAQYYYQDKVLSDVINEYIIKNSNKFSLIKKAIKVYSMFSEESEQNIIESLYLDMVENVKKEYKSYLLIISNKKNLDSWMRDNVGDETCKMIKVPIERIKEIVNANISKILESSNYKEFVSVGMIDSKDIRMPDSSETELGKINKELEDKLIECIEEYIKEAIIRKKSYDDAKENYMNEIRDLKNCIKEKQNELDSLGAFSFSKKKELKTIIDNAESKLLKYMNNNGHNQLLKSFVDMYR